MATWVTRKDLHVDRTACPWLVRRFIDRTARFVFIDPKDRSPKDTRSFDMLDAEFTHDGARCTFEVMVDKLGLADDKALVEMGRIVRGADIPTLKRKRPESEGLEAIINGIQSIVPDDAEKLRLTHPLYEALYAYCQRKLRTHRSRDPRRPALRVARIVKEHLAE